MSRYSRRPSIFARIRSAWWRLKKSPPVRRTQKRIKKVRETVDNFYNWRIKKTGRKITEAWESALRATDRVEGGAGKLWRLLTLPFRIVWKPIAVIGKRILPKSVQHRLARSGRRVNKQLDDVGDWLVGIAEKLNLDKFFVRFAKITKPIWRPFAAVGGFLNAWGSTRKFKNALWGLPALILLLPFVFIVAHNVVLGSSRFAPQYREAMKDALEASDYAQVQFYERKLAQLGVDTKRNDYLTAISFANDDKMDVAYERMQRLAPEEEPGYASAHFWIVQKLLANELEVPSDESQRLISLHIDHLESLGIDSPEIKIMRALLFEQQNKLTEAVELLEPLVSEYPDAAIERLRMQLAGQRPEDARSDARAVRMHMQDRKRRRQPFTSREFQSWAMAEQMLGNRRRLQSVLEEWYQQESDDQIREPLTAILRYDYALRLRAPQPNPQTLAGLMVEANQLSNEKWWVQAQTEALYGMSDRAALADAVAQQILQSDRATSILLEAFGTGTATSGRLAEATPFFERAVKKDPKNDEAWNNLAWILTHQPTPDLQRAMAAVEKALQISPDDFRFRETRGQVLLRLDRWQESIDDLEFAVNGLPEAREIHDALAVAYGAIGNSELAEVHRARGTPRVE